MNEIKLSGTTVIDNTGGTVTVDANQLQIGSTTVIDNNKKLSNVDIVPKSSFMFRNKIINGGFDIWQRGTSQTSSGYGSADRWQNFHSGSTKTASQQAFTVGQTDVAGNPKYYLRHVVSSVAGSGNRVLVNQKIEGVSTLAGQTVTLSFWAKADSNKSIATEFVHNFGTGGSPSTAITGIQVVTHSLTTSWQKFTATVSIPSISGKTIGSDNNDYISFAFWFDAGSDYNSRTNSLGQQSGTFDIAQVQLEEGTVATPFEHRPIGMELSLCQRYYQKSYDIGTVPGTDVTATYFGLHTGNGVTDTATNQNVPFTIHVNPTMRAQPTFYYYSLEGTLNRYNTFTAGAMNRSETATSLGGFWRGVNIISGYTAPGGSQLYGFCYVLTAEL